MSEQDAQLEVIVSRGELLQAQLKAHRGPWEDKHHRNLAAIGAAYARLRELSLSAGSDDR